jgi:hypothetical protein
MAKLSDRIKIALDEIRMLVLGTQVLTSLQFELSFQSSFNTAPLLSQRLVLVGLFLLLCALILLLWGPAYHRIAWKGKCNSDTDRFMTSVLCAALWPLAAGLGVDGFIAVDRLFGNSWGIVAGGGTSAVCASLWFVLSGWARRCPPPEVVRMKQGNEPELSQEPKLHERVNQVLTEARVVLPGAQAMLGFAFITMFTREFDRLAITSKVIHLACIGLIALTVVLLMTPAAFHRIAEAGEDSERLVKVASRCVVGALLPLALAISGDFFVVARKIAGSVTLAAVTSGILLILCLGLWFGYTWFRRMQLDPAARHRSPDVAQAV